MKRICIFLSLPILFAGCSGVRTVEEPEVIAENILPEFVQTEDAALQLYYADEIAECGKLDAAHSVYALQYDLNEDGAKETISYLLSTLDSGSSGNIVLHVHSQNEVFSFSDAIFLNPHPDGKNCTPKLQVMGSKSSGYFDVRYMVFDDSGVAVNAQNFRFNGSEYIS